MISRDCRLLLSRAESERGKGGQKLRVPFDAALTLVTQPSSLPLGNKPIHWNEVGKGKQSCAVNARQSEKSAELPARQVHTYLTA